MSDSGGTGSTLHARPVGVRVRSRGVRLPGHGAGDDRRRFVRPGGGQRPIDLRAVDHRQPAQRSATKSKSEFGFDPDFEKAKHFLEENDGAGNTFKATAKPVLIGTAVVGATTLIFSIIMVLTDGLTNEAPRRTCRCCIRRSCWA